MLPKPLYEAIPYLCLAVAAAVALSQNDLTTYISGGLFYIAGSLIWIKRSTYRREQRLQKKGRKHLRTRSRSLRHHLPERLYEFVPFVYIAAGFAVMLVFPQSAAVIFAVLFWSAGGFILYMRSSYRRSA